MSPRTLGVASASRGVLRIPGLGRVDASAGLDAASLGKDDAGRGAAESASGKDGDSGRGPSKGSSDLGKSDGIIIEGSFVRGEGLGTGEAWGDGLASSAGH